MNKFIVLILLLSMNIATSFAGGTRYIMRVDGLACPYCAYGVEKKLKKIKGMGKINVDLNKGIVTAEVQEGIKLSASQMTTLFKDAGFTYRSMRKEAVK